MANSDIESIFSIKVNRVVNNVNGVTYSISCPEVHTAYHAVLLFLITIRLCSLYSIPTPCLNIHPPLVLCSTICWLHVGNVSWEFSQIHCIACFDELFPYVCYDNSNTKSCSKTYYTNISRNVWPTFLFRLQGSK